MIHFWNLIVYFPLLVSLNQIQFLVGLIPLFFDFLDFNILILHLMLHFLLLFLEFILSFLITIWFVSYLTQSSSGILLYLFKFFGFISRLIVFDGFSWFGRFDFFFLSLNYSWGFWWLWFLLLGQTVTFLLVLLLLIWLFIFHDRVLNFFHVVIGVHELNLSWVPLIIEEVNVKISIGIKQKFQQSSFVMRFLMGVQCN